MFANVPVAYTGSMPACTYGNHMRSSGQTHMSCGNNTQCPPLPAEVPAAAQPCNVASHTGSTLPTFQSPEWGVSSSTALQSGQPAQAAHCQPFMPQHEPDIAAFLLKAHSAAGGLMHAACNGNCLHHT